MVGWTGHSKWLRVGQRLHVTLLGQTDLSSNSDRCKSPNAQEIRRVYSPDPNSIDNFWCLTELALIRQSRWTSPFSQKRNCSTRSPSSDRCDGRPLISWCNYSRRRKTYFKTRLAQYWSIYTLKNYNVYVSTLFELLLTARTTKNTLFIL